MHLSGAERVGVFVDWANLSVAAKFLGFEIDDKRLQLLRARGGPTQAMYFMAICEEDELARVRPLVDWLSYDGFAMVTEPIESISKAPGRRYVKLGLGIARVVDAVSLARYVDHIILFSGEGASRNVAATFQQMGKRVSIVLTKQAQPGAVAAELRRQADQFINDQELGKMITRELLARRHGKWLEFATPP